MCIIRNRHCLLGLCAFSVICFCLFSGFSIKTPEKAVQSLIQKRTAVFQNLAAKNISRSEAETQLRRIEGDKALRQDLERIEDSHEKTDTFIFVKCKELKQKKQFFQYTTYEAEIQWDCGYAISSENYNLVIEKQPGGFKLIVFEPQEG